jgi:galactarate dehydratase
VGYTFEGYKGADGSVTRNLLGITTTVQCVTVCWTTPSRGSATSPAAVSDVDDVIALSHDFGCGVAFDTPDVEIPIHGAQPRSQPEPGGQALSRLSEMLQPAQVIAERDAGGSGLDLQEPWLYRLQDSRHGFAEMIERIMALAERRLHELDQRRRETCPASALVLGMQCGGSDAFSGITANPALGFASDLLVRAGATVMFSEVTEVRDAVHLLTPAPGMRRWPWP